MALSTTAAIAASLLAPAAGGAPATFEGTCSGSGAVRQKPPMTNTPAPGTATAKARGACSGTLTDSRGRAHALEDEPLRYRARASGTVGCGGGTAEGAGVLTLRGEKIAFRLSEVRGPGVAAIRFEGASGGSAAGEATVSTDEGPAEIAERCGGPGLRTVRIDFNFATTPAISG